MRALRLEQGRAGGQPGLATAWQNPTFCLTRGAAVEPMDTLVDRLRLALAGRYDVARELGRGGMAVVFLAEDLKHHRQVAIKVLEPELGAAVGTERFLREIEIAAGLSHPHILPVYDSGQAGGLLYYVMPYVEGPSLAARIERERQLPIDAALEITRHVASALEYAHGQGIIHRDIKPANILLAGELALVADFGIARAVAGARGERLTETGMSVGTPQYMSPEQALGDRELDARSDIYSLGCVLFTMLAGDPPFAGSNVQAVIARVVTEEPPKLGNLRRTIPPAVEATVSRALAKAPADRFATATEFVDALRATGRRSPPRLPAPATRRTLAAALAGAGLLAAVAFLTRGLTRDDAPAPVERQVTFDGNVWEVALSPDGELVAYVARNQNDFFTSTLQVRDVRGGEPVRLASRVVGPLRWTPDGAGVLAFQFSSGMPLVRMPRLGGSGKPVFNLFWTGAYDLVPDGDAYVMAVSPRGDDSLAIYVGPAPGTVEGNSRASVFAGGRLVNVAATFSDIGSLAASPDGRWVAVGGQDRERRWVLGTVATDGSVANTLRVDTLHEDPQPAWGAASGTLYFLRSAPRGSSVYKISLNPKTGTNTGGATLVHAGLPTIFDWAVSRDGSRLAYSGGPSRTQLVLMVKPVAGPSPSESAAQYLTNDSYSYAAPAFSPRGDSLAYARSGAAGEYELYVRAIEGTADRRVTTGGIPGVVEPVAMAWSPDGTSLALLGRRADDSTAAWVVRLASGRAERVADPAWFEREPRSHLGPGEIVWSPDSKRLLVDYPDSPNLLLVDLAAGTRSLLLPAGWGSASYPVFHPDGRRVGFYGEKEDADSPRGPGSRVVSQPGGRILGFYSLSPGDVQPRYEADVDRPLLWRADGRVYALRDSPSRIVSTMLPSARVDADDVEIPLPFRCPNYAALSSDATMAVCAVRQFLSDVWVIDHFDRAVR